VDHWDCVLRGEHDCRLIEVGDNRVTGDILPSLWGRIMVTGKPSYYCPSCEAIYRVVEAEACPLS
jgi:hypothetical protein